MRFAGQRFRLPKQGMPNQRAESGYQPDFKAPVSVQGISAPMLNMRAPNAANMAFTAMPEFNKSPVVMPEWNEAQFRA